MATVTETYVLKQDTGEFQLRTVLDLRGHFSNSQQTSSFFCCCIRLIMIEKPITFSRNYVYNNRKQSFSLTLQEYLDHFLLRSSLWFEVTFFPSNHESSLCISKKMTFLLYTGNFMKIGQSFKRIIEL